MGKYKLFTLLKPRSLALVILGFLALRFVLSVSLGYLDYFVYEAPFYDTGTFMSLLICLEHIYVSYYLIIIIVMVY